MTSRLARRTALALAALSLSATTVRAQPVAGFLNTGVGATGVATDPTWSLVTTRVADGSTVYGGAARTIDDVPEAWADNQPGTARWIGASNRGDVLAAGAAGDDARRFRHVFAATFDLSGFLASPQATTLAFRFGADNYFADVARGLGVRLNGGAWLNPLGGASCAGLFGFDRAGTGCFTAANGYADQMSGTVSFDGSLLLSNAVNTIEFAIEGDGQTDGLFVTESRIDGLSTVPEPSTYALLATGMGALAMVARRRAQR